MPRRGTGLRTSLEFERVYRQGSTYRGRLFAVHTLPSTTGRPRLGLSVSKKVGTAVTRNLVRRRLKEVFHHALSDLQADVDLVVSARPASARASFEELNAEFFRALSKLGLIESPASRKGA